MKRRRIRPLPAGQRLILFLLVLLTAVSADVIPVRAAGETIDITVTKEWVDNEDADGARPSSVPVTLCTESGTPVREGVLRASEGWTLTFADVPRYGADHEPVTYTVREGEAAAQREGFAYASEVIPGDDLIVAYPTNVSAVIPDMTPSSGAETFASGGTAWTVSQGLDTSRIAAPDVVFNVAAMTVGSAVLTEYDAQGNIVTGEDCVFSKYRTENGSHDFILWNDLPADTEILHSTDHSLTLTFAGGVTVLDGTATGTPADVVLTMSHLSVYKIRALANTNPDVPNTSLILFQDGFLVGPGRIFPAGVNGGANGCGAMSMDLNIRVPGITRGSAVMSFQDIDMMTDLYTAGAPVAVQPSPRHEAVCLTEGFEHTIYTLPLVRDDPTAVSYTSFHETADGSLCAIAYTNTNEPVPSYNAGFVCRANLSDGGFGLRWTGTNCSTAFFDEVTPFAFKATVDGLTAGGSGGSITHQGDWTYRDYGEPLLVTMTPDSGCRIASITIDGNAVDLNGFGADGMLTVASTGYTGGGRTGTEDITLYRRADGVAEAYFPSQYFSVTENGYPVMAGHADHWIDVTFAPAGTAGSYTIVNTLTGSITGTKTWVDGHAPHDNTSLTFRLRRKLEGEADDTAEDLALDASQVSWDGDVYTISGLPVYDEAGNAYVYLLTEGSVAGYTASYDGYDITNTRDQQYITVMGVKVWDDGNQPRSHDNASELNVMLYRESETVAREAVNAVPVWRGDRFVFSSLPLLDDAGFEFTYTVEEEMADPEYPEGLYRYEPVVTETGQNAFYRFFRITNTLVPRRYDLTVTEQVSGNLASRDEYFCFTVEITGADPGIYAVDLDGADPVTEVTGANPEARTNPSAVSVGADGTGTAVIRLRHGQEAVIRDLTGEASFVITETAENGPPAESGYSTDVTVNIASEISDTVTEVTADGRDIRVDYLNTKNGVIPTGAAVGGPVLPIFAGIAGVVGIAVLRRKRSRGKRGAEQ